MLYQNTLLTIKKIVFIRHNEVPFLFRWLPTPWRLAFEYGPLTLWLSEHGFIVDELDAESANSFYSSTRIHLIRSFEDLQALIHPSPKGQNQGSQQQNEQDLELENDSFKLLKPSRDLAVYLKIQILTWIIRKMSPALKDLKFSLNPETLRPFIRMALKDFSELEQTSFQ